MDNPHGLAFYKDDYLGQVDIVIIGLGAIGSNLATSLVRQGAMNLWLVDFDKVELANCSTTTYDTWDVSQAKVNVLTEKLLAINENLHIKGLNLRLNEGNLRQIKPLHRAKGNPQVLVLDCVDFADGGTSRVLLHRKGYNTLHFGVNDAIGMVCWDEHYTPPSYQQKVNTIPSCHIPYTLNLIHSVVGYGGHVIMQWLKEGVKNSSEFNLHLGRWENINKR